MNVKDLEHIIHQISEQDRAHTEVRLVHHGWNHPSFNLSVASTSGPSTTVGLNLISEEPRS